MSNERTILGVWYFPDLGRWHHTLMNHDLLSNASNANRWSRNEIEGMKWAEQVPAQTELVYDSCEATR